MIIDAAAEASSSDFILFVAQNFFSIFLNRFALVPLGSSSLFGGLKKRSNNAKANSQGIGEVPDALRNLWVLLLPFFTGSFSHCAAKHLCRIIPTAATNDTRVFSQRDDQRVCRQLTGSALVGIG